MATCFTWGVTALGAALVLVRRDLSLKTLDTSLGFAGGVMVAASVWSLLIPALALAPPPSWLAVSLGFLLGGLTIRGVDALLPHMHSNLRVAEGLPSNWSRTILLVLAIVLHNIPEGLAVGVAYGAVSHGLGTWEAAVGLTIGIGLQNFPEGMAVAFPLRREGMSPARCFWWGQLSGAVEPVAGMLGAALVLAISPVLPYAMSFAAGAMIFVVVEEVLPAAQSNGYHDRATLGFMLGFTTMMILDVALG